MKAWRLLFLGFGNVGRGLGRLLLARGNWLAERGLDFRVTGILTRRGGLVGDPEGLDLARLLEAPGAGVCPGAGGVAAGVAAIRSVPADIVVEMTPLRVDLRGEPAITHVRAALEAGRHVVSANKGPVAWAYRDLDALARSVERRFLFESTVMDGTPVFSLCRHTLAGCRVTACRGILNTTTNYVLSRLAAGVSLAEAVRGARREGFAEADPSLDLDGWDAAVKLSCLANVLMGAGLAPEEVERTGISRVTPENLAAEARRGRVVKLVAEATAEGTGEATREAPAQAAAPAAVAVTARVRPVALPLDDPLATVSGTSSALTLTTDLMGRITVFEHDPALGQTAYGVFRDLLEITGIS